MNDTSPEFRPIDRSAHELLIVDDNPASRYATARILRAAGFRTREAATAMEGIAAAHDAIAAMVIDVHLPDMDGFELCRVLRSRPATSHIPVLHLTAAYVTDEDKVRGLDAGADAYITHPVEPAVLVATVQALVRTRVAEEAMRRSEVKFRAIYAQAPSGIAVLGDDGQVLDANPAMLGFLGRDFASVQGQRLSAFVPADWTECVDKLTRRVTAVMKGAEFPVVAPDGRITHLECSISPHTVPSGTLMMASDVTGRAALEQQKMQLLEREQSARNAAEQVSRMKDELIAVLSHELRTPLSAISGWTHVLQSRASDDNTKRGLAAIERNVRAQTRMISDLLDMSRLNVGKLPLNYETVDPRVVLVAAIEALQAALEGKKIQLDLRAEPRYANIRADRSRFEQVIWNLLTNAIKFSSPGGTVEVTLTQDAQGITLRVADQGRGIPRSFLPFVFDRFAQSDSASNRHSGGLGLGLSIAKQLVEAHGGTISAFSEGEGLGATFDLWMPAHGADEPVAGDAADSGLQDLDLLRQTESVVKGLRLLVVDDDREAHAMLKLILGDRGAVVESAYDFEGALEALKTFTPDVLISDIGMPGKDGYALMTEVRRRELITGVRVPAVALTAFSRAQDAAQALAAGFDGHCPKPLRPLLLLQVIQQVLQAPR